MLGVKNEREVNLGRVNIYMNLPIQEQGFSLSPFIFPFLALNGDFFLHIDPV